MIRKDELIVDIFAGAGGASTGIWQATGRVADIAINHDKDALDMYAKNHPGSRTVLEDVWKANIKELVGGRKVGWLHASPDCFTAETTVLTSEGLRYITEVRKGDLVLTHKNRWRRVTGLVHKRADVVRLVGQGHYGLETTANHEVWSPGVGRKSTVTGLYHRGRDNWRTPLQMVHGGKHGGQKHYWASPTEVPPEQGIPIPPLEINEDFWFFVGRWVADGSANKSDCVISCGKKKAAKLRKWFRSAKLCDPHGNRVVHREQEEDTVIKFIVGSVELERWLKSNFGCNARTKSIPTWALSMQLSWRKQLLMGYEGGDSYLQQGVKPQHASTVSCSTASKKLAVSMKLLAQSVHSESVSLYYAEKPETAVIEGREVNQGPAWRLQYKKGSSKETFKDMTGFRLTKVKRIEEGPSNQLVYCLQVEEDESFVADGIVVHNCRHFSNAKGSAPVSKSVRSLAWVVCKWARDVQPRVITLENVRAFTTWGPVVAQVRCQRCNWKGTHSTAKLYRRRLACPECNSVRIKETGEDVPEPTRKGETFQRWIRYLRRCGYDVQWRDLCSADYGAPTIRSRLYLVARRDGRPIVWPKPTHSEKGEPLKLQRWVPAHRCIDWDLPVPSIFGRKKPLVEKTMRRIARGVQRYVLDEPKPFIMHITHSGDRRVHPVTEPVPTITAANRGELALVRPELVRQELVASFIAKHFGGQVGSSIRKPLPTITTRGTQNQLISVAMATHDESAPVPILRKADRVYAFLMKYFGTAVGQSVEDPFHTVTTKARFGLVLVYVDGESYMLTDIGMRMLTPRELARAQGFKDSYWLLPTKTKAIASIGNSVTPPVMREITKVNLKSRKRARKAESCNVE